MSKNLTSKHVWTNHKSTAIVTSDKLDNGREVFDVWTMGSENEIDMDDVREMRLACNFTCACEVDARHLAQAIALLTRLVIQ